MNEVIDDCEYQGDNHRAQLADSRNYCIVHLPVALFPWSFYLEVDYN